MHLTFRPMEVQDIPAVLKLRLSTKENAITLQELEEDYGITPKALAEAMHAGTRGWLCETQDRVVGYAMGSRINGEVKVVAVHPAYEGRGIGKLLLSCVRDWLFAEGMAEIWLLANPDPAIRAYGFYRKLGRQALRQGRSFS